MDNKEEKTFKLRVRSNTEDVVLKEKPEQTTVKPEETKKDDQPTQFYDDKMRDVWGSRFNTQTRVESNSPEKPKVDQKVVESKPKTILQDVNKLKEPPKTQTGVNVSANRAPTTTSANVQQNKAPEKKVDKEHVAIEKIFRISLVQKENFLYLKEYTESLEERKVEKAFRINDLDSIILLVITSTEKKNTIFAYLLETYYRAYEMIDKKYKSEFDERFQLIRKTVVSYINILLNAPLDFDIFIEKETYAADFKKFYLEKDTEYIENFLADFTKATCTEFEFLKNFFVYYFEFFFNEFAYTSSPNYYNFEKLKKHLKILTKLLNDFPDVADILCEMPLFNPMLTGTGRNFQQNSFLGAILSHSPMDTDPSVLVQNISTKSPDDNKRAGIELTKSFSNVYITEVSRFVLTLLKATDLSRRLTGKWFYSLININVDRKKTYFDPNKVTRLGCLLNSAYVLMKILYENKFIVDGQLFTFAAEIDPLFVLSGNINYSSYEKINTDSYNQMLELNKNKYNLNTSFNLETVFFFTINSLFNLSIRTLESEYLKLKKRFNEFLDLNATNDPMFKECVCVLKSYEVYLKNSEFNKYLLKFANVNVAILFILNSSKYTQENLKAKKIADNLILDDFSANFEQSENKSLTLMPLSVIQNISNSFICLRIISPEALISDQLSVRMIAYYSVIYSSNPHFITTNHYRAELLDLLLFVFSVQSHELKLPGYGVFTGLLQDPVILNHMVPTLIRNFIDSERLGTPNQFYQKFSNRSKVLSVLMEVVLKQYKIVYTNKIIENANKNNEDCLQMINYLMNDLTYLNDEAIEKLEQIKKYQDLRDNIAEYNSMDEESKKLEDEKFVNNDRIARVEIRLLNQSIQYMTILSGCISQHFIKSGIVERLANLLNYTLSIFTTPKGMKLKVKNMKDYGFDPKLMLINLVAIYNNFKGYKKFLTFVVKDPRSFRLEHFEKVIKLQLKKKIEFREPSEVEGFLKMIQELKVVQEEIKSQEINYDDAPEEFLDNLNYTLMEDPVLLPSSKVILDRTTIETHLLSDPSDPFNRSKLTKDMLIPCPELKERIEEYKRQKKNK